MSDSNSSDPLRKTDLSDPLRQMSLDDSSKKGKKKKESDSDRFESLEKRLDKMNDSLAKFFAQKEEKKGPPLIRQVTTSRILVRILR